MNHLNTIYFHFSIPIIVASTSVFWNIEMPFEPTLHHPLRLNGFSLVCVEPKLFRFPAMEKQRAKKPLLEILQGAATSAQPL